MLFNVDRVAALGVLAIASAVRLLAEIQPVSVALSEPQNPRVASGYSSVIGMSSNGLQVLFISDAPELVTNDFNGCIDVFVRDRAANQTILVSANALGQSSGNAPAMAPVMSSDGTHVVFESAGSDFVTNAVSGLTDLYLRDLPASTTRLVSVNRAGTGGGNGTSRNASVSATGRFVAFESLASDLVEGDTNMVADVFVRDCERGETLLVSVNSVGTGSGNGASTAPLITPDGRFVAFVSRASDLAPDGRNDGCEVFVRDLQAGVTYWASTNAAQLLPDSGPRIAHHPALSDDGRFVAFKVGGSSNVCLVVRHGLQTGCTDVLDLSSIRPWALTNTLAFSDFSGPRISADGQTVAYASSASTNSSVATQVYVWEGRTRTNRCVSLNFEGASTGNTNSGAPLLSADGGTVVFQSMATNLVAQALNGFMHVYARDLATDTTRLISADLTGAGALKGDFGLPALSGDGRWVAFDTTDSASLGDPASPLQNVYLRDRTTDAVELVSRPSASITRRMAGLPSASAPNGLSADGRFVVFTSAAADLAPNISSAVLNVYRRDMVRRLTELVSVNREGTGGGDDDSLTPAISADGRWVAFASYATNFIANDTNRSTDVYVRDMTTGVNLLVSENYDRTGPGNARSDRPWISDDGQRVVFQSQAGDLLSSSVPRSQEVWFVRDLASRTTTLLSGSRPPPATTLINGTLAGIVAPRNLVVFHESSAYPYRLFLKHLLTYEASIFATNAMLPIVSQNRWVVYCSKIASSNIIRYDLATAARLTVSLPVNQPRGLSISADGRLLAYQASGSTLTSLYTQVFTYDFELCTNRLVSVKSLDGLGGNGPSFRPIVSPDGRYVVFSSQANDLVASDTDHAGGLFVRDLALEITFALLLNRAGRVPGTRLSGNLNLARNGRTLVFDNFATDLSGDDDGGYREVYLSALPLSDLNGNGLDDAWEIVAFGDQTHSGTEDFDGDGMSNRDEFVAGTDPANARSVLQIAPNVAQAGPYMMIYWSAVPGKTYRVQYLERLEDPAWRDVPGDVSAFTDLALKVDETSDRTRERFYRILVIE